MNIEEHAATNLKFLSDNPYTGRGIVLGLTPDGRPTQIYYVMGRSPGSRNRILDPVPGKHGWLRTSFADQSKVSGDPGLLIYNAMAEEPDTYIVSNGAQTDAVMQNGDPLPPFHGEPLIMPIKSNDPAEIAEMYWSALDADNKVALAVKVILSDGPSEIEIINRY